MTKLWYMHTVGNYAAAKKNEEDVHEMTWRDCQDILSSGKKQRAKEYL